MFVYTLSIIIYSTEKPAEFVMPLQDITSLEHTDVEYVCKLSVDVEKPKWYMGEKELEEGEKIQMVRTDKFTHKLVIKDIIVDDEGPISVLVKDKKSSASLFVQGIYNWVIFLCSRYLCNWVIFLGSRYLYFNWVIFLGSRYLCNWVTFLGSRYLCNWVIFLCSM